MLGAGHEPGKRATNPYLLGAVFKKLPIELQRRWWAETDYGRRNPSSPSSMELVAAIAHHISATARNCAEMLRAQENPIVRADREQASVKPSEKV
jgi:hypothetical protein